VKATEGRYIGDGRDKSAPTSALSFNRRVEQDTREGCPYISHGHMNFGGFVVVRQASSMEGIPGGCLVHYAKGEY
jgi:hypothetical protein